MDLVAREVFKVEGSSKWCSATICAVGISACAFGVGLYFWRRRWVKVGVLTKIFLHPLKSGKAVEAQYVECNPRGPSMGSLVDRGFMVVNSVCDAIDLRGKHPSIVLVELTHGESGQWKLSAPGMEQCVFEEPSENMSGSSYRLLDIHVTGLDCGDEPANWISSYLGDTLRLVKHFNGDKPRRPPRPKYCKIYPETVGDACVPLFADVTPYMLTTEPSMKDLNIKLPFGMEIDHRSFRPSFVVDGPDLSAWEEDCWTGKLRIGEVVFTYNKPCVRCIGTKVKPDSGTLYEDHEPLKTLKTFRQHDKARTIIRRSVGDSPLFGMHYSLVSGGMVREGDSVWVQGRGPITDQGLARREWWQFW